MDDAHAQIQKLNIWNGNPHSSAKLFLFSLCYFLTYFRVFWVKNG
jgi:hypothetical protein